MVAFITGDCRKYTKVENTFFKKEDIIPPNKKKKWGLSWSQEKPTSHVEYSTAVTVGFIAIVCPL